MDRRPGGVLFRVVRPSFSDSGRDFIEFHPLCAQCHDEGTYLPVLEGAHQFVAETLFLSHRVMTGGRRNLSGGNAVEPLLDFGEVFLEGFQDVENGFRVHRFGSI